jgi:methyl-accepting chemotaxis protein
MGMSKWTIGKKLTAGFLLILCPALSIVAYSGWTTWRASNNLQLVSAEYLPESELAIQIERDLLNARIQFIYFVTIQKPGSLDKGWPRFRNAQQQLAKLRVLVAQSGEFAGIRPQVDQLSRDFASYDPALNHIIDVVQRGENHGPEFTALIAEWARLGGAMVDSAGQLSQAGADSAMASTQRLQSNARRDTFALELACLGGLLAGSFLTIFISRDVSRGLRKVITQLAESARQVTEAASQIASSAQSSAQGASEQAASLEETWASTEEINSMAVKNAGHSKSAAGNMLEASARIDEANLNLEQMLESMAGMNASSTKISKIIKVIDDIAFQTNILALNAAVEAARAGEAGLGFAVVADEVRNLAQRSAQAAKDTAELIEESIATSSGGRTKLNQVTAAVTSITASSHRARTQVEEVKLGSEQQARGIEHMAKAITEMRKSTQTSAATAEQSAASSEHLSAQAESLRVIIDDLMIMAGGAGTGT